MVTDKACETNDIANTIRLEKSRERSVNLKAYLQKLHKIKNKGKREDRAKSRLLPVAIQY